MWLVCIIPKLSRVVVNGSILCTLYTLFDVCVICHVRCGVDGGRNPNHTKKHYSIWRDSGFHQVHFPWNTLVLFDLRFRLFGHIAFDVCIICHVWCGWWLEPEPYNKTTSRFDKILGPIHPDPFCHERFGNCKLRFEKIWKHVGCLPNKMKAR